MPGFSVRFRDHDKTITVDKGTTLLDAAIRAGIRVNAACGGEGICGKCVMRVLAGSVEKTYLGKLTEKDIASGYVLSCASRVIGDVEVETRSASATRGASDSGESAERFVHAGAEPEEYGTHPMVKRIGLRLDTPTLENNVSDHDRITDAIAGIGHEGRVRVPIDLLKELPGILRSSSFEVSAVLAKIRGESSLLDVGPGDTNSGCYIAVIDIGTTTVVLHLVDALTAKTIAACACFNSQGVFGAEVTTRIIASEKKGVDALKACIIEDINTLVREACGKAGVDGKDVYAVVCAGNTVMTHFLLGLPVANVRRFPYVPVSTDAAQVQASGLGIRIAGRAYCVTLPCISGWVGGDISSGVLFTRMHEHEGISMLVDIGTNGEIVIGCSEWLIATSASAGPALEGAGVECGIRAEAGAVSAVFAEGGAIRYSTIGDAPVKGICGSGIIDLVAVLFSEGITDRTGRFTEKGGTRVEERDGVKRYVLVPEGDSAGGKHAYITEPDIANVITAKAAIYAAMKILLKRIDAGFESLAKIYIGGAFGNYINIESAIRIGLLPDTDRTKIEYAGNTSLKGAKIAAFSATAFDELSKIRKMTTAYDLMGADDYVEEFRKAMFLPHTDVEEFGGDT